MFEIKVLFCAPSGRTGSYNVHPAACPCTPLVYRHNNSLKKCAHTGRTAQKNVRPSTEMCAPGAVCTLNFEHCLHGLMILINFSELMLVWKWRAHSSYEVFKINSALGTLHAQFWHRAHDFSTLCTWSYIYIEVYIGKLSGA